MAENADQQRHGNQRGFPEEIEEEQIQRSEHADQRRFQNQQQDEKFLHPLVNRLPRNQHAQRREKCGEHHQPQRNAVDPHVVVNVRSRNPLPVDLILKTGLSAMEINRQMQRQHKRQQRNDQRENADVAIPARQQHQQQSARQRNERHQRKNDGAEIVRAHRAPIHIQIMKAITTAEPAAIHPA